MARGRPRKNRQIEPDSPHWAQQVATIAPGIPKGTPKHYDESVLFRCALGHSSWGEVGYVCVQCPHCPGAATFVVVRQSDLCVCGDALANHGPHCKKCGVTDNGEGEGNYVPKCDHFFPML